MLKARDAASTAAAEHVDERRLLAASDAQTRRDALELQRLAPFVHDSQVLVRAVVAASAAALRCGLAADLALLSLPRLLAARGCFVGVLLSAARAPQAPRLSVGTAALHAGAVVLQLLVLATVNHGAPMRTCDTCRARRALDPRAPGAHRREAVEGCRRERRCQQWPSASPRLLGAFPRGAEHLEGRVDRSTAAQRRTTCTPSKRREVRAA